MIQRRAELRARYSNGLSSLPEIERPSVRPGVRHAWHLYAMAATRDANRSRPVHRMRRQRVSALQCILFHYIVSPTIEIFWPRGFGLSCRRCGLPAPDPCHSSLGWPSAMSTTWSKQCAGWCNDTDGREREWHTMGKACWTSLSPRLVSLSWLALCCDRNLDQP
jgi:hypothetical protein